MEKNRITMSALLTELQKLIDAAVERRVREELAKVSGARYGYAEELAEYLQVSTRTISNYVAEGMPHHTFGQRKRFNFQAVDEWIERRGAGRQVRGAWESAKIKRI